MKNLSKLIVLFLMVSNSLFAKDIFPLKKRSPASDNFPISKCEAVVKSKGLEFLKFFTGAPNLTQDSMDDKILLKSPVSSPDKKRNYEVLETIGYVYKGTYRLRFIFAVSATDCDLMGQEILEI